MEKKSTKASLNPPLPPAYRMLDNIVEMLPEIQRQQKETIRFVRAEIKAMTKFLDNTEKISFAMPKPWPPVYPMLDKALSLVPGMIQFDKEFKKLLQESSRNFAKLDQSQEKK